MPYPLEALRGLRADEEEAARRALALAVEAHAQAVERTRAADAAHAAHLEETERAVARELAQPLTGALVASARALAAWRTRRKAEAAALADQTRRAREAERARDQDVETARDLLASARREREAIEKHHARWQDEERKRAEAKAEAEIDDRPRR
ncbi:MAG: hypothetical protein K1X94_15555 [Sandaracinaceae bacterium]|nr:hypothetical protein [Sandaracinaceae bacterium]